MLITRFQGSEQVRPGKDGRWDVLAERILGGRLAALLGLACLAQLATWMPHYLTWPWWPDHDVFATLALGWEAGSLPNPLEANFSY